jgi:hypothetical protein
VDFFNGKFYVVDTQHQYDRQFGQRRTIVLPDSGCHDIVRLEDNDLVTTAIMANSFICVGNGL